MSVMLWTLALALGGEQTKIKPFESPVVNFTDEAPKAWTFLEAKKSGKLWSDRDYRFSKLPAEIAGGTLLYRDTGFISKWLDAGKLEAKKDGTAYAIIRWRYLGKDVVDEATFARLEKDGWKPVKGEVETTFPAREDWRWRAFRKTFEKGEVILDLKTAEVNSAVVFVFK